MHDPGGLAFLHRALPQLLDERQWAGEISQVDLGAEKDAKGSQWEDPPDNYKERAGDSTSMAAMTADVSQLSPQLLPGLPDQQQAPASSHAGVGNGAAGNGAARELSTTTQIAMQPASAIAAAAPGHPHLESSTPSSFTGHGARTTSLSPRVIGLTLSRSGTALASSVLPLAPSTGSTVLADFNSTTSSTPQTGAGSTVQAGTGSTVQVPAGSALAVMEGTGVGLSISRTSTLLVQHQELGDGEWVEVGEPHHMMGKSENDV
jgi:hypothetical protein